MQYEFLKNFPKRMKNVGMYAVLVRNSTQKTTWKQYGFAKQDEQINIVFAVMLYVMEQSLKEENCTMDDIGSYIDNINMQHFGKELSYDDCRNLGDFIINVILSNEGRPMYFDGFDFEQNAYHIMHVSYVANKIVYIDQELKRTSYYLTDDGYNLLLSTFEIENNMKLTIHEMIFKMQLERQSYDKALDEIKNVFNRMRIQLQKIREAMEKIRRNALNYSVKDYEEILTENLDTISDTKERFKKYRETVKSRAKELEEENINVKRLSEEEEEKLKYLREIEVYLNRTIDEHQKILNSHFDLKELYTRELEELAQMSLIKRFQIRTELYDKILENPQNLENIDYFFRPLFNREIEKIYNLNKALELQRPMRKDAVESTEQELDFDDEKWQEEQEKLIREKLKLYETSLLEIISLADETGEITLAQIEKRTNEDEKRKIIPKVSVFKEIMVEMIKNGEINVAALRKERNEYIHDSRPEFQLNEMVLYLTDEYTPYSGITKIETLRDSDGGMVLFRNVPDEEGRLKDIRCSNVIIRVIRE